MEKGIFVKSLRVLLSAAVLLCSACGPTADDPAALVSSKTIQKLLEAPRQGPTLLVFWATWCAPCIKEIPTLQELHEDAALDLQIVSVSLDAFLEGPQGGRQLVVDFLQETPLPWKQLVYEGSQDELFEPFELSGMIPYSILYDAHGEELIRFTGKFRAAQVRVMLASHTP